MDGVMAIVIAPLWLTCVIGWALVAAPLVIIQTVVDKATSV